MNDPNYKSKEIIILQKAVEDEEETVREKSSKEEIFGIDLNVRHYCI
jgi:hypothetical protein